VKASTRESAAVCAGAGSVSKQFAGVGISNANRQEADP
jgi:hypothetical protein